MPVKNGLFKALWKHVERKVITVIVKDSVFNIIIRICIQYKIYIVYTNWQYIESIPTQLYWNNQLCKEASNYKYIATTFKLKDSTNNDFVSCWEQGFFEVTDPTVHFSSIVCDKEAQNGFALEMWNLEMFFFSVCTFL